MERSGVLMLFFDLPVKTSANRKAYRVFMKYIKSVGFLRLQESVYVKLQRNTKSTGADVAKIKANAPSEGDVMMLPLTAPGFSKLVAVCGKRFDVSFLCDDVISL